ncbi:CD225/dispanin family protein [Compostibacter hankyongensis]|uniref:CD225/dispanin family protein n=1 Tax=Compostibacter hankyongensis TaxID=1007089 RepID=A0ABP8FEZ3_9BACT
MEQQPVPQPGNGGQPVVPPKNWLVESILVTIFCCLPFGIVGIINASKVNSALAVGNYDEALRLSKEAGKWTKIGFFVGLALIVISVILQFVVGVAIFRRNSGSFGMP